MGRRMRIAYVDVIEVHPDYRGKGIGRALMGFVEGIAKERKAQLLKVQPDEEVKGFYESLGFNVELFAGTVVWIHARGMERTEVLEFSWQNVENLELVAGRFQSSYSMFFSAFKDNIAGIHYTVEAGKSGDSYYALRNLPGREGVALLLWGRIEDVKPVLGRARVLGFGRILTVLQRGTVGFGVKKVGEVKIMGKPLT